jgi:hypothetical protein
MPEEVIKVIVERVPPEVRGGGGFGVSGYLRGEYMDGFQGHAQLGTAIDHAIRCLQRYKEQLLGDKMSNMDDAMKVQTVEEADAFIEQVMVENNVSAKDRPEKEQILRSNAAYFAGYYDQETRERIERVFKAAHPIFGSTAANGRVDPSVAFRLGEAAGKAMKDGKNVEKAITHARKRLGVKP